MNASQGELILVVDDDPDILETVEMVLELAGCRVARASSGSQALAALHRGAEGGLPSLVLLDLMLPDMRGEDVFEKLRALPLMPPVVVMSAAVDGAQRALQMGLPFLAKPFDLEDLTNLIADHRRGHLQNGSARESNPPSPV